MLENVFAFFKHFPEFNASLGAGLIIFARFLGFAMVAPIISRKDIPMLVKLAFSILMTISFVGILAPSPPPADTSLIVAIVLNLIFGTLIGFIGAVIFSTIAAAGDMINMQMGLSSAVMFDSSSKEQTSVMGKLMGFVGTIIFLNIGGMYWMLSAFKRGFDIFPLYSTTIPLDKVINIEYLTYLTGNVLFIGLQFAAPILIATLCMDTILGIISKIAPQINVFQFSFLFKPLVGAAIMIIILPKLVNVIIEYFFSFSQIY